MVPTIGLMIGAYIVARMTAALSAERNRERPSPIVLLVSTFTMLIALGGIGYLFYLSNQAAEAMHTIPSPLWP